MTRNEQIPLVATKKIWQWMVAVLAILLISGCAGTTSNRPATDSGISTRSKVPAHHKATKGNKDSAPDALEKQLRSKVRRWEGTPHRLGGTSRRGIDCSGFVQMLYREILQHRIPRSTLQQIKSGRTIPLEQLDIGDLVFFRLPYSKRHVGIYLGRSEFAHASATRGVMISSMDAKYWRNRFWMARRYVN